MSEIYNQLRPVVAAFDTRISEQNGRLQQYEGYFEASPNLFNPNDPDIEENVELLGNGLTQAKTNCFASGYIPVRPGQTFCANYPTGIYGSASKAVVYNENKERIGFIISGVERLTDSRGLAYIKVPIPASATYVYMRFTGYMPYMDRYMYAYASEMPSVYEPYYGGTRLSGDVAVDFSSIKNVAVSEDDVDFVKSAPVNLVDLSALVPGIVNNSSTSGDIDANASWVTTDYIPVIPGETYALSIFPGVYYGSRFVGVPYYSKNKTYLGRVKQAGGSVATIAGGVTITIPDNVEIGYIRTSYYKSYTDNPKKWWDCQIFHASAWPGDMYVPYDNSKKLTGIGLDATHSAKYNPLYGKSAMWNGDSICAADNDGQGGWPGRIASANGMSFKNYAVAGGTVTENTTAAHSVSATLDGMLTDFPNADYIIIEGGTNDADIVGDSGLGTFDAADFSSEYISNLNKDTFSGALESVFYRLVTTMKGKHIGYLIPQKMGHTEVLVTRRRAFFDRAIAICQKWGIPYLDLWNGFYINWRLSAHWNQNMTSAENETAGNLYQDGQHLTTHGYALECPVIAEWMKTI